MTIEELQELHHSGLVRTTNVLREAGLKPNTILKKIERGTELRPMESAKIEGVLDDLIDRIAVKDKG